MLHKKGEKMIINFKTIFDLSLTFMINRVTTLNEKESTATQVYRLSLGISVLQVEFDLFSKTVQMTEEDWTEVKKFRGHVND